VGFNGRGERFKDGVEFQRDGVVCAWMDLKG